MNAITAAYLKTWNAPEQEREPLLADHFAPEVTYTDPLAEVRGREDLSALITGVHQQFPGFVFTEIGDTDAHHRQLRFTWGLGPAGEAPVVVGFDVVVLDDRGLITDVRGFLDQVPA